MKELSIFLGTLDLSGVLPNCFWSLTRVMAGVLAAAIAGIVLGLIRTRLPAKAKRNFLVRFLFESPKFPPPIAWIPFVILAFGIGELSAIAIVFIGAFAPIFTSAYEGAESVSPEIRNAARSMEITGVRYLFRIILPASLPQIFTGLRVGIGMGWMSVIAAEMVSGQSGLGYSIQLNRLNLQYGLVTRDFFLIGLIGFLLYEVAVWLERKIIPWHQRTL